MSTPPTKKPAPNVDGMFTLKVDNISFRTTIEILKERFGEYGEVGDVYIPRNYGSNEPRGFAFVRFLDKRDAEDAQRALDGASIDGREIRIQEAKEKRPENPKEHMQTRDNRYGGRSDRDRDYQRGGDDRGRDREYGRGGYDRDRDRDYGRGGYDRDRDYGRRGDSRYQGGSRYDDRDRNSSSYGDRGDRGDRGRDRGERDDRDRRGGYDRSRVGKDTHDDDRYHNGNDDEFPAKTVQEDGHSKRSRSRDRNRDER